MSLGFSLIAPDRLVVRTQAESVSLPATGGEITVLPHHTHIVTELVPGVMHYAVKDAEGLLEVKRYRIDRGFAEVSRRGVLSIFTGAAELLSPAE